MGHTELTRDPLAQGNYSLVPPMMKRRHRVEARIHRAGARRRLLPVSRVRHVRSDARTPWTRRG
jgi:hypothetical protein